MAVYNFFNAALLAAKYPHLHQREIAVLELVCAGLPNKTISSKLDISGHTVRNYTNMAFKTMKVKNRTEATAVILTLGASNMIDSLGAQ